MKPFLLFFLVLVFSCTMRKSDVSLPELYNLGSRIDYDMSGDGDTTLLFVHGWCINKSYWESQMNYFKDKYTVVAMDLPGHGESDKNRTDWSVQNFSKDVMFLVRVLSLKNVVLIGHSMGGNIILEPSITMPDVVIGFVGVDNFKDLAVEYTDDQKMEMDAFMNHVRQDYEGTISGFASNMLFAVSTSKSIQRRVLKDILETSPDISLGILESLEDAHAMEGAQMRVMKLKVHLINSDGFPTDETQLEKYCARSYQLHSIGNSGHYPMLEDPDRFNEILENILKTL
jgi:sigma-B regulation protein RsbQ